MSAAVHAPSYAPAPLPPAPRSPILVPGEAPFQRQLPASIFGTSKSFPAVLQPSAPVSLGEAVALLRQAADRGELKALLKAHGGALLLRGLPVRSPDDFSKIIHACNIGPQLHEEVGRPPKRTELAPGVVTANEGPSTAPIFTHSEYGWSTVHPAYLYFFALVPAREGGETPLSSGIELYARLAEEDPDFIAQLRQKGLRYTYRYGVEDVNTSNSGASVLTAYGKDVLPTDSPETIREKVETQVRRHSTDFEWHANGELSVTHRVPFIRTHHATGLPLCFGNLLSAYGRSKHHKALEPPFLGDDGGYHPLPLFGDGSAIETTSLERADRIVEETRILLKWQQGDVVLFDNHAVQHGRIPWQGERRVLASLWDGESFPDEQ